PRETSGPACARRSLISHGSSSGRDEKAAANLLRVSVVTPSFNQTDFIGSTIESVLGQDYPNLEYLVVDGGSTDGTVDVLRSYGERLAWTSEPDQGQTAAINKGWRKSGGDILAW